MLHLRKDAMPKELGTAKLKQPQPIHKLQKIEAKFQGRGQE